MESVMQWDDLIGHKQQLEWFRTAMRANRLASSFLFVGPNAIGKRTFARLLAKSLLCKHGAGEQLSPCGVCEDCAQVEAHTHPDLIEVAKPADKAVIPIELLIGERESRMREGLCHDISLRPYSGRKKIAILDDADALNVEGANSLLKTLEEPPTDSLLILVGTSLQRQLPTIRSRCQAIIFRPLATEQLSQLLLRNGVVDNADAAQELAGLCRGSLAEARLLFDPELREFRKSLLGWLSSRHLPIVELSKSCGAQVDGASKDTKVRRERLKLLLRMAASFYRDIALLQSSGATHLESTDPELAHSVELASRQWSRGAQGAIDCWNRCLLAMEQVDRNANQASLLEAWAADLAASSGC